MSQNTKLIWERVHTFGSHTHIIKNKKTICGRDVSLYVTEVHKNPTKKCKRCLEFAYMFEPDENQDQLRNYNYI